MSQNLLVILLVSLIAGWLAGQIVKGTGFGLDIAIGIVGALIGSWLLPRLGIHLGLGIAGLRQHDYMRMGASPRCAILQNLRKPEIQVALQELVAVARNATPIRPMS